MTNRENVNMSSFPQQNTKTCLGRPTSELNEAQRISSVLQSLFSFVPALPDQQPGVEQRCSTVNLTSAKTHLGTATHLQTEERDGSSSRVSVVYPL